MLTRRGFGIGMASTAFAGLLASGCATTPEEPGRTGFGPLEPDPQGLLDLPRGFSYRIISSAGDRMDDGFVAPGNFDGMGAIPLDNRRVALVRNHELSARHRTTKAAFSGAGPQGLNAYDRVGDGTPLPGGTSTIVYDYRAGRVERQFLSLVGTSTNCAGGTTPWGSWLTCEENVTRAGDNDGQGQDHGWVFEVPGRATGPVQPVPLKAMGRFLHEAAAVDPRTGVVYLTEDREDGLFYRFLPEQRGVLARGGRLQALAWREADGLADSRNWSGVAFPGGTWRAVRWIDMDDVESPGDDLRKRGHARGAVLFARGEGVHFGDGELYFTCTSGGAAKVGQVMRYRPSRFEGGTREQGEAGRLQLFFESPDAATCNYADNLTVTPYGHLMMCEDAAVRPVSNHLRGLAPDGRSYAFGFLRAQTELAGVCFSPDGQTMFFNIYDPGRTVAVTGPWRSVA